MLNTIEIIELLYIVVKFLEIFKVLKSKIYNLFSNISSIIGHPVTTRQARKRAYIYKKSIKNL